MNPNYYIIPLALLAFCLLEALTIVIVMYRWGKEK